VRPVRVGHHGEGLVVGDELVDELLETLIMDVVVVRAY
jgi:hypothetical protein